MRQRDTSRRVLVTGGAGFLGSHLCQRLLNDGDQVLCADIFYAGHRDNGSALLLRPNFGILFGRKRGAFPLGVPGLVQPGWVPPTPAVS